MQAVVIIQDIFNYIIIFSFLKSIFYKRINQ